VSDGEDEFNPLESGLGAMRRGLGACPDAVALAGFAADSLPAKEAASIRAHVSMCGICDSLVERLRHCDDPIADEPRGWAATERRLRAKVFPKPRLWRWLLHPAVAYGIALAVVTGSFMPIRHPASQATASPNVPAPSNPLIQSLRVIDLNTTRGTGVPHFALGSDERLVLLSFLIDIRPVFHYEASLDGRTAQAVTSSDGKGNFAVLVSSDLLRSGAHRLTVTEINPSSGKVERSLEFPFQL